MASRSSTGQAHVKWGRSGTWPRKTSLTAAITKVLAAGNQKVTFKAYDQIDNAPEEGKPGSRQRVAVDTIPSNRTTRRGCPGHADYIKNMITGRPRWTGRSWWFPRRGGRCPRP